MNMTIYAYINEHTSKSKVSFNSVAEEIEDILLLETGRAGF